MDFKVSVPIAIELAKMDAVLPSIFAGSVSGTIVCAPSTVDYGVALDGQRCYMSGCHEY